MIPLEVAQQRVLEQCAVLEARSFRSIEALGLILATDVTAAEAVPPFRNSAVDGYAVRAGDVAEVPVVLRVVDEVAAGDVSELTLSEGQAIRIMTGAPVPAGADAVVMVERTSTTLDRSMVTITESAPSGAGLREAGSDVRIGEIVFRAGTIVRPAVAGVLASINVGEVSAVRRPRVAVVSTGDELVADGSELGPGQIRESNLVMLTSMLAESDVEVVDLGIVPDDEAQLEAVLVSAVADCDAVISSGGVSMGDYDVVKAVLGRIAKMSWMQVAIKPAKPFAFGMLDGVPIFGLPGNPVSSIVSFEMFARPALRKMAGYTEFHRPRVAAVAEAPFERRPDGRMHLDRGQARFGDDGRLYVTPALAQGSHQLAATALANALVMIPDGESVPAGAEVAVLLLN